MSNSAGYIYSILGLRFLCELPYEIEILEEAEEFLDSLDQRLEACAVEPAGFDLVIRLHRRESLPPVPEDAVFQQGRLYSRNGENVVMYMLLTQEKPPYACTIQNIREKRFDCYYLPGSEPYLHYSRQLSDLVGMETVFLQFRALILHAAFIRWQGMGILFTAPSGTGKSTQAWLWEQYEGAEILNGDRAGLRLVGGHWQGYGLPYAGSSGIYRNEAAPVQAVIILRQSKENKLQPVNPVQAVRYLYPEILVHRWDNMFVEKALELLTELAVMVPVYLLECRPDRGAVELVRKIVRKEEDPDGQYSC